MSSEGRPTASGLTGSPFAWKSMAESLIEVAAGVAQVPGVSSAIKAMKALAGIEDEQIAMLRQIGSDVQLIREGPLNTAWAHVGVALRETGGGAEYEYQLRSADDCLIQAMGQCASLQEQSVVEFNLGVIRLIRGHRLEARYQLGRAHEHCVAVERELIARAANLSAVNPFVRRKGSHAVSALRSYLPFAETVAQAHSVIELVTGLPEASSGGKQSEPS